MGGSTADSSWILCPQMVEDGVLQPQPRESTGFIRTGSYSTVLLSGTDSSAPSLDIIREFTSSTTSIMRTYGKNYKEHPATVTRPTVHDYKNRESTEWDVRLDLIDGFTSAKILEHAVAHKDKLKYCIIGAEEEPDSKSKFNNFDAKRSNASGSEEIHVHVAIILDKPAKRGDVLQLLRGPRCIGIGNEYCVPRNPKFTYAGWIAHHTKVLTKINPDGPLKLYEFGDLPMDAYNEDTCWKVVRMIKKFGNEEMKQRFKSYSTKLDEIKLAKAIAVVDEAPPFVEMLEGGVIRVRSLPESFTSTLK